MSPAPDLDLDVHQAAIAAGDAVAFGRFIAASELDVRRSLRPFAERVDVEAVIQEAFLRLWQVAPRFVSDGGKNGLLRLTARIARNLALSELRRRKEQPLSADDDELAVEQEGTDPMLRELIAGCVEKLPDKPRAAVRLRIDSAGSSRDRDLAEQSGMRLNTFLQNVTRARKLLADCLARQGVDLGKTP